MVAARQAALVLQGAEAPRMPQRRGARGGHRDGFAQKLKANCCSLGNLAFVTVRAGLFILASVYFSNGSGGREGKKKKNRQLLTTGLTLLCQTVPDLKLRSWLAPSGCLCSGLAFHRPSAGI